MLLLELLWGFAFINLNFPYFVSCEDGISLAFAIDDTRSMYDDIDQVRRGAKDILKIVLDTKSSEVKDFVLVTINDPDVIVRTRTKSHTNFLEHLNRIRVHNVNNYDCEERALAGIEKALIYSRPESYIYVFTDASTKELQKLNNITRLCQKKQSQVVFVLTGDCREPSSRRFTIYYDIAKACSGQVFRVRKDQVHTVLKPIEILLRGKNSILQWKMLPRSSTYIPVAFTLDEKAEYAVVSTSGRNVKLRVTTIKYFLSPQPVSETTMWNDNGKVLTLIKPKPGTYYAWVKGDSVISVVVYGRTDFTFEYGFSVLEPKSMRDTAKQPIADLKQHLTVNVTDPENSVSIKFAQILDIKANDNVIKVLPLKNIGNNTYITEAFIAPNYTFKIAVKGEIKKTHETITRSSRNIDPQIIDPIPESKPEVKIEEGAIVYVGYGSGVSLTCKVSAHPAPIIEWYSSTGVLLPSNSSVLEDPVFVSYLKLGNIKKDESYICKAVNKKGSGREKKVEVTVKPVLTFKNADEGSVYYTKYGGDVKIPCNINSYLPITIKWLRTGRQLKAMSPKQFISSDGSELTLKAMDINMQGKFTCEATLNSDPTIKKSRDIEVKISGLARPEIHSTIKTFSVLKGDNINLNCKIAQGYPKPQIKWFRKTASSYLPLSDENSEVLTLNKVLLTHAGQYKCVATNELGSDTVTFEVTVSSLPVATVSETEKKVPFDSNADFTCTVETNPSPSIVWKDARGSVLKTEVIQISEYKFVSQLKVQNIRKSAVYTCTASNLIGSTMEEVKVVVPPPFEVYSPRNEAVYSTKFGKDVKIPCNIKSNLPMRIQWLRSGELLNTSSVDHSISPDGSELTLKSMNIEMQGKYTCEAILVSDPTVKKTHDIEVKISGLAGPEIQSTAKTISVLKGDDINLNCKITQGYPKPQIKWFRRNANSYVPLSDENSEVLTVNKVLLTHAGQYKCVATNELGSDTVTFEVTVSSLPVATVSETEKKVPFDSNADFTCIVETYPTPSIVWKDTKASVLKTEMIQISEYKFVSQLKLQNIRESAVYTCTASNLIGSTMEEVKVVVPPPFEVNSPMNEAVYSTKFGEDVKIPCNIKSYLPMRIQWLRSGELLNTSSVEHSISPDGSELTLKAINIELQGKYTCEAILVSDSTVKKTRDFDVKIPGLARPNIQSSSNNISIMKGDKLELKCRIVQGYPTPQVRWFKKGRKGYTLLSNVNSEVLTVYPATFTHAGQHKCEVTNQLGSESAFFDVTIKSVPTITIAGATKEVPYDSNIEYSCKVKAYPPPKIVWKDEKGLVLQREVTQISEYEFVNQLKLQNVRKTAVYRCLASNNFGSTSDFVNVNVTPPFIVNTHITDIGIFYGSKKTLHCDIKSVKPMKIKWYKENVGVKSSRSVISSSEQFTISDDGSTLTIHFMDMDMVGKYTCEASLLSVPTEKVTFSTTANIVGLIGPEVIYSTTVLNDKNFTAICRIQGVPKPIISWQFKPKGSEMFSPVPGSGEEFNIPELKLNDTGVYKCVAKNNMGTTQRDFNVVVEEHPIITNNETNYYGLEGDLVLTIPCDVTGFPDPNVVWKKGGKVLNMDSKYAIKGTSLYINNPVQSDSQEFTCEANNKLGSATKTFVVEVTDNFDGDENYTGDSHEIHAEQGKSKSIKCKLANTVENSVRWYKDGILTNQTGSTYEIEESSMEDEANYTCRANRNDGSKSETYVLFVGYPPVFEDNSPSPITTEWNKGDQTLDCAVDSELAPTYEWIYNGKKKNGNNLQQIPITDWGTYSCHVSNVHGTVSKTFEVITTGCLLTTHAITQNQPLIFSTDAPRLPPPLTNSELLLKKNEEIRLSCPNNTTSANNFRVIPNRQDIIAKCITQDTFFVAGKTYRYSDLECKTKIAPSIEHTKEQCSGPDTEMIRVGFKFNYTLDLYNVCVNTDLNVPLYASAAPTSARAGEGVDSTKFILSSTSELDDRNVKNEAEIWKPEGSCKCCYTKGQLMSVNELAFGPTQAATFEYDLNSVPIWNPCGDSTRISWQAFIDNTRVTVLYNPEMKWYIWTGASEWRATNAGLVPRFLWKVLKYDESYTVMVYVNDKSPKDGDVRCSNSCQPILDSDKFLYCCNLEEFSKEFRLPLDTFKV